MAEKPRIRLPKQAGKGEVVEIKTLIAHLMESGQRKDPGGNIVPRKIINRFTCSFNGKPVFEVMTAQGNSAKTTYYDLITGEPIAG